MYPNKTIKLTNSKSRFEERSQKRRADEQTRKEFEIKADAVVVAKDASSYQGVELIMPLIELLRDKTLPENKGALAKTYEQEIRNKWKNFIIEKDNDEQDPAINTGTHAAITLIMKVLFEQRDRINSLEWQLNQLKKN